MKKKFKHLNKKYKAVISTNEKCTGCDIPHTKEDCTYKRCWLLVDEYVVNSNPRYFNEGDKRLNFIFEEIKT